MFYIGANDLPLDVLDTETCEKRVLMFDCRLNDYFLDYSHAWNMVSTPVFTVALGDHLFNIPSSAYTICGEAGGETDIILFEEIIGRDIQVVVVENGFRKLSWYTPRIVGINEDGKLLYPMVSQLIPIYNTNADAFILTGGSDRLNGVVLSSGDFVV